jgi:hypothetical protein
MPNTYIEYAKGGTDYRAKGTISCWVKRSELGREQYVWGWGENNSSDCYLRFDTADNIEINADGAGTNYNSTALFRDTNAWYHFVFSIDGQNSTANLRRRFWINGVQQDEGQGSVSAFSAAVFGWHSSQDLWIGANPRQQQASGHSYFNGLISHFHYCSNYSYTASDFGEYDANGVWKIKTSPNVQYGSEGFFLKMENSSNMDLDSSSNNKTLTTNGTLTKTEDSPSNVFATFNSLASWRGQNNTPQAVLANGNLKTGIGTSEVTLLTSTIGVKSGKYYWEAKSDGVSKMFFGVVNSRAFGETNAPHDSSSYSGIHYYEGTTDFRYYSGATSSTGAVSISSGDILGFAMDCDNSVLWIHKNGVYMNSGVPTSGDTGTGAINRLFNYAGSLFYDNGVKTEMFASAYVSSTSGSGTASFNFGNGYFGTTAVSSAGTNASGIGIFEYDVPTGFTALSTKGLNL